VYCAWLWLVFTIAALALYGPALSSPFFSDDLQYIVNNPYIHSFGWREIAAILDPNGEPAVLSWNYAPLHLLVHMLQWQAFGSDPLGYHVTNVLLHAGVSALLALLFERWGMARGLAWSLAAIFLVHPANVETVAWIFQVKTILAQGFAIAALLLLPKRPLLATALFTLGMLAKITALFAVPVAGLWLWLRTAPASRREWRAWGVWVVVAAAILAVEFPHFQNAQADDLSRYADLGVHVRSIVAIAGRYLAMAFGGYGLAVFHETPPSTSLLDPWWWFGLLALTAIGVRSVVVLRRGSVEAVYWAWAAASFVPISQIFPFLYPMGDHYLYPILPGLLGAVSLVVADAVAWGRARFATAGGARASARALHRGAAVAIGLALVFFTVSAFERSRLWRSELTLVRDSADRYPDGRAGLYLRARRAATHGNYVVATEQVGRLADLGFDNFVSFHQDPVWAPMLQRPDFAAVLGRMADHWLRATEHRPILLQSDLRVRAMAYLVRGDLDAAVREYERALAKGGPLDELLQTELRTLRERTAAPN
jgi:hypothetical protein